MLKSWHIHTGFSIYCWTVHESFVTSEPACTRTPHDGCSTQDSQCLRNSLEGKQRVINGTWPILKSHKDKLKVRNNYDKSISVVYLLSIPCLNTIYSHPVYCILKNRIQDTLQRYQTERAIRIICSNGKLSFKNIYIVTFGHIWRSAVTIHRVCDAAMSA